MALILGGSLALIVGCSPNRSQRQNIQMNNQTCPVTGNQINDKDTYIYEGKEYKLCSDKCKQTLSENPKKYLPD